MPPSGAGSPNTGGGGDGRREAELAAELARLLLRAPDLRTALDRAGEQLAQTLKLPFAFLESEEVAGDERRWAIPLRDGATVLTGLRPSPTSRAFGCRCDIRHRRRRNA